jgi:hypothetical protein
VRTWLIAVCFAVAVPAAAQDLSAVAAAKVDRDRDGLSDQLEQALLDRFAPTLLLARGECAVAPASFEPFALQPRVLAQDGTLYGQAFPIAATGGRAQIELHYFHLWSRDCGRLGHDLDAEHVSAIVSAADRGAAATDWIADAWYAAAHEGSACDASSGALAGALGAQAAGPRVFVSRGKHASYFDRGQCKWGCGGDECGDDRAISPRTVINIGEFNAAMNGALWVHSRRWPLAGKLSSDFDPARRASLEGSHGDHIVSLMVHLRAPQAPVLAGDTAIDGLSSAAESTAGALSGATRAVAHFLRRK